MPFPGFGQGGHERYQDPGLLGQLLGGMQQQQPGMLDQFLGSGGGSSGNALDNPFAEAAMTGIAAMAVKKMMGGR